jgi:hypothetical protein
MTAPKTLCTAAAAWMEERRHQGGTSEEFAAFAKINDRVASSAFSQIAAAGLTVWQPERGRNAGNRRRYFAIAYKPAILGSAAAASPARARNPTLRLDPNAQAITPPGLVPTVWQPPPQPTRCDPPLSLFTSRGIGRYLPGGWTESAYGREA